MDLVDKSLINQQINENEKKIPGLLLELKKLLKEDGIPLPPDEGLLLRFIRARKFNIERIHKSFKRYVDMKRRYREFAQRGVCPSAYKYIYDTNAGRVLANRDKKGRHILHLRTKKWNPNDFELLDGLLAMYLSIEGMGEYIETQLNGIVIILDLEDLSFHQARQMTLTIIKIVVEALQDTIPVSFQEIHIVNHPMIFNMIYAIAKPFIKEKLRNRLIFHGHNVKAIHKSLSPDILPHNLGGNLTNQQAWDNMFLPQLYAKDDFYKAYVLYGAEDGIDSSVSEQETYNEIASQTKIQNSA